jgi:hypothetical protein
MIYDLRGNLFNEGRMRSEVWENCEEDGSRDRYLITSGKIAELEYLISYIDDLLAHHSQPHSSTTIEL